MGMRKKFLLCGIPIDYTGSSIISNLSGYPYKRKVEAAGKYYQEIIQKLSGQYVEEQKELEETTPIEETNKYEKKRHKKTVDISKVLVEDPYEIMGLEHLRWRATEEDIKQAYRRLVLKYHPDKNEGIDDEIFKKISNANNLLCDPRKRRILDSSDDFDEYIPTGNEKHLGDFYQIFGPVFQRFSKWSVDPNVPSLGDNSTPYEDVVKFYNFWFQFKSWREYNFEDEFDPNEAETREEKRWMEKQNEKERRKKKKEESQRIFKLTENSEKCDPRIKKYKDELKKKKEQAKQAKTDEKKKRYEEAERQSALEKERIEIEMKKKAQEAASLKKKQQDEMKKWNRQKSIFRNLVGQLVPTPLATDVEMICATLPIEKLILLVQILEKKNPEESKKAFEIEINAIRKEEKEREKVKQIKKEEPLKPWTEEELSLLTQAVARYPGGATNRWEKISDYIGTRNVKEIISKVKETKFVSAKIITDDPYHRFTKTKKKSEKEITSEMTVSYEQIEKEKNFCGKI